MLVFNTLLESLKFVWAFSVPMTYFRRYQNCNFFCQCLTDIKNSSLSDFCIVGNYLSPLLGAKQRAK